MRNLSGRFGAVPKITALMGLMLAATIAAPAQTHSSTAPASVIKPASVSAQPDPATPARLVEGYGKLPLAFEANQGQTDSRVKFLSRGSGYTLFLTGNDAVLALQRTQLGSRKSREDRSRILRPGTRGLFATPDAGREMKNSVLTMHLVGADPHAAAAGTEELPGKANYFIGNDPKKWRTNVATYAKVKYENLYPGVDLVYYGNQGQIEYDFVVAPGADPGAIALDVAASLPRHRHVAAGLSRQTTHGGVKPPLRITANGDLLVRVDGGELRFHRPVVYQPTTGNGQPTTDKTVVEGNYRVTGDKVSFEVPRYDHSRPLVIDPVLSYATYLGGTLANNGGSSAQAMAVDASGNVYLTGYTYSSDFPTTPGAISRGCASCGRDVPDAFVTKLNPSGSTLLYSTYLGGGATDEGYGIAVDAAGDAYVAGYTTSRSYPITPGAFQPTCPYALPSYCQTGFVTELNPEGSALIYSTFLGGLLTTSVRAIAVDAEGDAFVTGYSDGGFPTTPGSFLDGAPINGDTAFVTELNPTGSNLLYSTDLFGKSPGYTIGNGIAIDSSGDAYVTGQTSQAKFPTTPGAFQQACPKPIRGCAFATEFNPTFSQTLYSTFLDGSNSSGGAGIAVDSLGEAYVTGSTNSTDFPVTPGAFQTTCGTICDDAFVTKFNATGSAVVYSTYLAGDNQTRGTGTGGVGITVDSAGDAYVAGDTNSLTVPIQNPIQAALAGGTCPGAPVTMLSSANSIRTGTGSFSRLIWEEPAATWATASGLTRPGAFISPATQTPQISRLSPVPSKRLVRLAQQTRTPLLPGSAPQMGPPSASRPGSSTSAG
jgi:hypothetical protein